MCCRLIILLLWAAQPAFGAPDPALLKAELDALRSEISAVKSVLEAKQHERSGAERDLQTAELAIAQSAQALLSLNQQLITSQSGFEQLTREHVELSGALASERATLGALLRSAYAIGQLEQLKLALSQERIAEVGRVLAYHAYVNRARISAIERIQQALARLVELRAAIAAKQQEIVELLVREKNNGEELTQRRQNRSALLARLQSQLATGQTRLAELSMDQDRLNELLGRLTDVLADIPRSLPQTRSFTGLRGALPWPLVQPGSLLQRFGAPTENGRAASGLLIAADLGSQVNAVARGRVAFADWLRGFGMLMILDHGDGYMSLYGQCEALLKSEGDWVEAGEMLATVGAPSAGDEPALHFELRRNRLAVDPMPWLLRR